MKQPPHELCPMCDSTRIEVRHDRLERYRYLKQDHVLAGQEHTVCLDCGTSFYLPGQIERNNERFAAFEKSIVKGISPNDVLSLREKYQLSQEQAARIFRTGKTAFSKWERGEVAPTGTAGLLLQLALEQPSVMKSLAEKAGEQVTLPAEAPPVSSREEATVHLFREVFERLSLQSVVKTRLDEVWESKKLVMVGSKEGADAHRVQWTGLMESLQSFDLTADDEFAASAVAVPRELMWQEKRSRKYHGHS